MSAKQLLRGHRGRKARRFLKRHPESYIVSHMPTSQGKLGMIVFGPAVISDEANQLVAHDEESGHHEDAPLIKDEGDSSCKTCGATGDNPCVTKSGKIASKEHASRRSL